MVTKQGSKDPQFNPGLPRSRDHVHTHCIVRPLSTLCGLNFFFLILLNSRWVRTLRQVLMFMLTHLKIILRGCLGGSVG